MPRHRTRRAHPAAAILCVAGSLALTAPAAGDEASPFAPLPDPPAINEARAALGKFLFFDERLSGDTMTSCATCHDPAQGWTTRDAMAPGYTSTLYFRNAPGLFNAANRRYFMWDGRLEGADLGTLVRDMITEAHTMNMDSRLAQERLAQVPEYREMFQEAYGAEPYGGRIYGAIGEYLKTIRTQNAPFDLYLRGDESAMSAAALRGMELFAGQAGCVACHSGPMLSDGQLHRTGVRDHPVLIGTAPGDPALADPMTGASEAALRQITLLRHYATMGVPNFMNLRADVGHYVVTKDTDDIGRFVTPSLWDVGQTAPYMHSGAYATLGDVVAFYNAGPADLPALGLSTTQQADLVAFLESLTGDAPAVTPPDLPAYQLRTVGQN